MDRGDLAVAGRADADVVDLVAAVDGHLHVLAARRRPLHGPLELARDVGAQRLFAVDVELGAEAAAHLGRDDPEAVLGDPEHAGKLEAHEMGDLRRGPQRDRTGAEVGHHAARLDRRSGRAVVDDAPLDDDVGLGERLVDVPAAQRPVVDLVGAELLVDERRAVLERGLGVDHHRQRLVVDEHVFRGVDHRVLVLADDDGHGVADVADLPAGQRPVLGRLHLDPGRDPGHG